MNAIEIHLNSKRLCVVGTADGTVYAHLFCAGARSGKKSSGYLGFIVDGLDAKRDEHIEWMERALEVGDEVVLRIVRTAKSDPPRKRVPTGGDRPAKEAMVRRMAKELGWKITTK